MKETKLSNFWNADCNVHYWYREGIGEKFVLFFHGAGADHRMFERQLELFDESYHLVLWDARGHGRSKLPPRKKFSVEEMVQDCLKLYELLGTEKAILIGQSMGGNLAQEIAYHYPDKVEKLVLIDCTKNTGKLTAGEKILIKLAVPLLYCYPQKTLFKQSAFASSNREEVRSYLLECFEQIGKARLIEVLTSLLLCLHEDLAYRFAQPVLLLCGVEDASGNIRKIAEPWAQSDSNIRLHMVENASHCSHQDQPEVVNRLIAEFLF